MHVAAAVLWESVTAKSTSKLSRSFGLQGGVGPVLLLQRCSHHSQYRPAFASLATQVGGADSGTMKAKPANGQRDIRMHVNVGL